MQKVLFIIAVSIGTVFSVLGIGLFLRFATLLNQSITNAKVAFESNFYKMLDYHFQHMSSLTVKHVRASETTFESVRGKRAFIVFRLHLERDVEKSLGRGSATRYYHARSYLGITPPNLPRVTI